MYYVFKDVDFLCKCLNLLYLIKELILVDLTTRSRYVGTLYVLIYELSSCKNKKVFSMSLFLFQK